MEKAKVGLVGFIIFLISLQSAWAQKEKFQSIFIYNFSKYVKWPEDQNSGVFVIGVYGSSSIQKDLTVMASSKKVNGLPIEVKQFKSMAGIDKCHILFVASSDSDLIAEIVETTKGSSVLVVTDSPGMTEKGASINFVEEEGKIKFELNQQMAESRGLKVSGSLLSLAILV